MKTKRALSIIICIAMILASTSGIAAAPAASSDADIDVLFDIFDLPAAGWQLNYGDWFGDGEIAVTNTGGAYTFHSVNNQGWPNAVFEFSAAEANRLTFPRES